MALPFPIIPAQTDAKSPVDDVLADSIREDLDYLDQIQQDTKTFAYEFKFNGFLANFAANKRRRVDGALITKPITFTKARLYLEVPGNSGSLICDVRKYRRPNTPITAILAKYSQTISTIANIAPALATQSITRSTSQITTQSITLWKSSPTIVSIVVLPNSQVRYNLNVAPDSDWQVGDSVTFSGTVNAANSFTTTIVRVNSDLYPNIIVTNAAAINEPISSGGAQLNAWSYNFTNPVSTQFVAGESAAFAAHSTAGNNGTLPIYAINSGGNNIVVKNSAGATQAGVAGTTNVLRWVYSFTVAASTTDFIVGESIKASAHTSAANDGNFRITAVNSGGNNVVAYNTLGVAQGGIAGVVNTNRWIYSLPTNPSSQFIAGEPVYVTGATNPLNDGTFTVKEVNRSALNNIIIYNEAGVAQGGAGGTLRHGHKVVSFASDQSAIYTVGTGNNDGSRVELINTADNAANLAFFEVLQVNRGGGANYNVVISNPTGLEQNGASGRIFVESRSIFKNLPTLTLPTFTVNATNRHMQVDDKDVDDGDFNSLASCVEGDIVAADMVTLPLGSPETALLQIT